MYWSVSAGPVYDPVYDNKNSIRVTRSRAARGDPEPRPGPPPPPSRAAVYALRSGSARVWVLRAALPTGRQGRSRYAVALEPP